MLEFREVSKNYPAASGEAAALHHLSVAINSGEFLSVIGPSGAGKTTLLRLIAALEQPTTGQILRQQNIQPPAERIAFVFQKDALFPHLNAEDNIAVGLRIRKIPGEEIRNRIVEMTHFLGLNPSLLSRYPDQLSAGERQRVSIARALTKRLPLVLMDEPFSNLDPMLRRELRGLLKQWQIERGATMVLVTHDQEEALALSDRVAILNRGKLVQLGTPEEVYHRPANVWVAQNIGHPGMNLVKGRVNLEQGTFSPEGTGGVWSFGLAPQGVEGREGIYLGIRPEALSVRVPAAQENFTSAISATVQAVEFIGRGYMFHLLLRQVRLFAFCERKLAQKGETLCLDWEADQVHWFDQNGQRLDKGK
jgi:ABC-type sugar transport system ATPase subunit